LFTFKPKQLSCLEVMERERERERYIPWKREREKGIPRKREREKERERGKERERERERGKEREIERERELQGPKSVSESEKACSTLESGKTCIWKQRFFYGILYVNI
jgi:hypothetical protein